MSYSTDNIFAKILCAEAPAAKVYEDAKTLAFMDAMPQVPGHTLVIPKYPSEDLFGIPPDDLAATIKSVQLVGRAVRAAFESPGIMIAQLSGREAGQTVFHLHFHILPRHHGLELKFHAREFEDIAVLESHAQKIRDQLARQS
ncbi:MAG: HIT family protein [Gammaproteobacteria bacterium]|nr:HIT family protein [Gammaproteobacteria bacterium]